MTRTMLFLGHGYVASRMAAALRARGGWRLRATVRDPGALRDLARQGVKAWLFDGTAPLPREAWEGATHVLSSVPPGEEGDPVLRWLRDDLCRHASMLDWVGYLSTVGVYGDHGGAWVDEETPPAPVSARGRRRLAAERGWLALRESCALPVHVFRLPGIYGPGRNPLLKALHARRAALVVKPGQVFSRIHVDDLVAALLASIARPCPGRVYNIVDDEPAPPHEVALFAHRLLGLRPPPLRAIDEVPMSEMARSFYGESKRVSNARARRELGWRPSYPTYREGLRALLAAMDRKRDS